MRNKRTIPILRDRIRKIGEEQGIPELLEIADEMFRSAPKRRAKTKSRKMTPELAQHIRQFWRRNRHLHQRDIAQEFNVNPGRVSEAVNDLT